MVSSNLIHAEEILFLTAQNFDHIILNVRRFRDLYYW